MTTVWATILVAVQVTCVAVAAEKALYAGGDNAGRITWWNGMDWQAATVVRGYSPTVNALIVHNGLLVVAGQFELVGNELPGLPANNIAAWDGQTWSSLGTGIPDDPYGSVDSLASNGTHLFAAGDFGDLVSKVAVWDGTTWSTLPGGPGMASYNDTVLALAAHGPTLYVGGRFDRVDGKMITNVAVWDGAQRTWSGIGFNLTGMVWSLAMYNGSLFVGGSFNGWLRNIARWNMSSWDPMVVDGVPGLPNEVRAMAPFGEALAAMRYNRASPELVVSAFWTGAQWISATNTSYVATLFTSDEGVLYGASGYNLGMDTVREWRGDAWIGIGPTTFVDYYVTLASYCSPGSQPYPTCGQCYPDFFGPECTRCDRCTVNNGTCYDGVTGNCSCPLGRRGTACGACSAGYYGRDCADCSSCGVNGVCTDGLRGNCTCFQGWGPSPSCDACLDGFYGAGCTPCAACQPHGTCYEGLAGNCTCDLGWAGTSCAVCATGWAGADCADCESDYFRVDGVCVPCTQCEFGFCGEESCQCFEAWVGPTCSECALGFYGSTCFDCDVCAVHGYCIEGREGRCECDPGWTGPKCQETAVSSSVELEPWAWSLIGAAGAVIVVTAVGLLYGRIRAKRLAVSPTSSSALQQPLLAAPAVN